MEPAFAFMQKMTETERNEFIGSSLPEDLALSYLSLPAYRSSAYAFLFQCSLSDRNQIFNKLPPSFQGAYLALDTNAEFAEEYLKKIPDSKYSLLVPHLDLKLINIYQAQKPEKEKKQALDKYLTTAIQALENLETGLKSKNSHRINPMYPFPFYFAKQVENNSKVVARADTDLWTRFQSLKQSCLNSLNSDYDDMLLETAKSQANQTLTATFKSNVGFLNALKKNLESKMETSEIKEWIERQRRADNYSYPFHTQPSVLKFMAQTATAEKLRPFSESFSTCLSLLQARGLDGVEKPTADHEGLNALMQAMDQLETISNLQNLIKNQTT
jgi:hypothetical protein